jgi:hypothetical protein
LTENTASWQACSWFFELAHVLVRFDHVASGIINADHSVMGAAAVLRVADWIAPLLGYSDNRTHEPKAV